jgi:NADP-reducing hydrogenase subunit HndD
MEITIDNKKYQANIDDTILEVCRKNNIYIPTLCEHVDLTPIGHCRICIVDVNGKIKTACNTKIEEKMTVITSNETIDNHRKLLIELMIGNEPDILKSNPCKLLKIAKDLNVNTTRFEKRIEKLKANYNDILEFDNNKCINCGKCIQKCQIVQSVFAIDYENRSCYTNITPYLKKKLQETVCTFCGQCSLSCPTGAIVEHDQTQEVINAIKDPKKHVIVQTAPSIRASIGETQGMPAGSHVTGKLVSALKKLGFDKILDTNFGADLTIIEEGTELITRIQKKLPLPLITSCSPGWILFAEHYYPELIPNISTCKSPMQMESAIVKTYYAKLFNYDPKDIICVAIMPCTAKKFEAKRPEMNASGGQDTDYVLTTRELGRMIKSAGIDFKNLEDSNFDNLLGSGAGTIFGATGGVMEAALRYAADVLENKDLDNFEYKAVRGLTGVKEASVTLAGLKLNVAVSHGLANARKILQLIKDNPTKYHFVEIMACTGGCIGGGGQPRPTNRHIIKKRAQALYDDDKALPFRKSQQNVEVKELYHNFLGKPGDEKSHKLLHTHYKKRNKI